MKRQPKHKITLELPDEFVSLCARDHVSPQTVLRGFIADLCGLKNRAGKPRPDGYAGNGAAGREGAQNYYAHVGYAAFKGMWEK